MKKKLTTLAVLTLSIMTFLSPVVLVSAKQDNRLTFWAGIAEIDNTRYYFVISEEYEGDMLTHRVILSPEKPPETEMSGVRHSDGEWGELRFCAPHKVLDFEAGCVMSSHTNRVWSGNSMVDKDLEIEAREFMLDKLEKAFEYGVNREHRVSPQIF
jgi:hypothetical protein